MHLVMMPEGCFMFKYLEGLMIVMTGRKVVKCRVTAFGCRKFLPELF